MKTIRAEDVLGNLGCIAHMKTEIDTPPVGLPYIKSEYMIHFPDPNLNKSSLDMRKFEHSYTPNTEVVPMVIMGSLTVFTVVARRTIPPGESLTINHNTTFTKCCCGNCLKSVCSGCGKIAKLSSCSKCRMAGYCSKACQIAAWDVHKAVCAKVPFEQIL